MSSLEELARAATDLSESEIAHLKGLVASWHLLADLCFADLVLYAPARRYEPADPRYVLLGHVRPSTAQTLYPDELLASEVAGAERPLTHRAFRSGESVEGVTFRPGLADPVSALAIPVRLEGRVLGVLSREWAPNAGRRMGELETAYLSAFDRFAEMVRLGEFPYAGRGPNWDELPRVGDGVILLDEASRVRYASPNANSALRRLGVLGALDGRCIEDHLDTSVVRRARTSRVPELEELTDDPNTTVQAFCLPLLERRRFTGGLLLVRDVSDLRRLDRLLVTKDAHIREIHHRVKNNLQTISSLLHIQARRVRSAAAQAAIEESVRRIGAIATVHETLSRDASEDVQFENVARPVIRMVAESLDSESGIKLTFGGGSVRLPAVSATPLALVLSELVQNAVWHAFPATTPVPGPRVDVSLCAVGSELRMIVADNGVGLPEDFDAERSTGLGLSIVRALVQTELGGQLQLSSQPEGPGTRVSVTVPIRCT